MRTSWGEEAKGAADSLSYSVSASALQPIPLRFPGRCPAPPGTQMFMQKTSGCNDEPALHYTG